MRPVEESALLIEGGLSGLVYNPEREARQASSLAWGGAERWASYHHRQVLGTAADCAYRLLDHFTAIRKPQRCQTLLSLNRCPKHFLWKIPCSVVDCHDMLPDCYKSSQQQEIICAPLLAQPRQPCTETKDPWLELGRNLLIKPFQMENVGLLKLTFWGKRLVFINFSFKKHFGKSFKAVQFGHFWNKKFWFFCFRMSLFCNFS